MAFIVALYAGEEKKLASLERPLVLYADDFDVRGLYDEFEIAARLELVSAPDTVRRQHMERTIDKLFPQLKKELRDKMMSELKTWPPKLDPMDPTGGAGGTDAQESGQQPAGQFAGEITGAERPAPRSTERPVTT
jgi:hypothetical protein